MFNTIGGAENALFSRRFMLIRGVNILTVDTSLA